MLLEGFDSVDSAYILKHGRKLVLVVDSEVVLAYFEEGVDSFESDCDHLHALEFEHGDESLDHALLDKHLDQLDIVASGAVGDSPDRFLLDFDVVVLEHEAHLVEQSALVHLPNLLGGSSSDVADRPANFLPHHLALVGREFVKESDQAHVDQGLGCFVSSRHQIPNRAHTWDHDSYLWILQEIHEFALNVCGEDVRNAFFTSIRQVREGPTDIEDCFGVCLVEEHSGKRRHGSPNQLVVGAGVVPTQVAQTPGCISCQSGARLRPIQDTCDRVHSSRVDY